MISGGRAIIRLCGPLLNMNWPWMTPRERRNFSALDAIHNARWMEKATHSLSRHVPLREADKTEDK